MMRLTQPRAPLIALCALLVSKGALAQGDTKITAEALFQEGRRLVGEKRHAEACPKFAESQRLDPSAGTLLNLASCYESTGRLATAWATYKEAASAASIAGRADNLAAANRRAAALTPRLARLTVRAPQAPAGLTIKRDGALLDRAAIDVSIPVDPGEHTIEATAPKKRPWSKKISISQEGADVTVAIPPLDDAPEAPPAPAPVAGPASPAKGEPPAAEGSVATPDKAAPLLTQQTVGFVVAGVGVVGLGIGTWFALSARSKFNTSVSHCATDEPNRCSAVGVQERDDARSAGNIATVSFAVAGAALATGVTLVLLAPATTSPASARLQVAPSLGGAMLSGAF